MLWNSDNDTVKVKAAIKLFHLQKGACLVLYLLFYGTFNSVNVRSKINFTTTVENFCRLG